jgi:hypothetical protein
MEEFTMKELQEDLDYLQYYLENVINDIENMFNCYLENIQYPKFQDGINANIIISKHINKKEFELYLSILKKYKEQVFDFVTGDWYKKDLETANVEYTINVLQWDFINFYIRYLKSELKNKLV